jgi:hypothetical protein
MSNYDRKQQGYTCAYLVGTVRSHGSSENHRAFNTKLDKGTSSSTSSIEGTEEVHIKQVLYLLFGKVERGLMVGSAGVDNHSVQSTGLGDDLVDGCCDSFFLCDIGIHGEQLAGETLGQGGEVIACFADVD